MHGLFGEDGSAFAFPAKKKKMSEEERLQRCRERNRIHARNTRERKKATNELLEVRIAELSAATMKLKEDVDTGNLAKVLVSLGGFSDHSGDGSTKNPESDEKDLSPLSLTSSSSSSSAALGLSADEMERRFLEMNEYAHLLHKRELSAKTPDEIELMRRERNRIHARKTRLRKKKALAEMQQAVETLQNEIYSLKSVHTGGTSSSGSGGGSGRGAMGGGASDSGESSCSDPFLSRSDPPSSSHSSLSSRSGSGSLFVIPPGFSKGVVSAAASPDTPSFHFTPRFPAKNVQYPSWSNTSDCSSGSSSDTNNAFAPI